MAKKVNRAPEDHPGNLNKAVAKAGKENMSKKFDNQGNIRTDMDALKAFQSMQEESMMKTKKPKATKGFK